MNDNLDAIFLELLYEADPISEDRSFSTVLSPIRQSFQRKAKNCKKGKPCGGSCQSKTNVCFVGLSADQKALALKARKAMQGGGAGGIASELPESQNISDGYPPGQDTAFTPGPTTLTGNKTSLSYSVEDFARTLVARDWLDSQRDPAALHNQTYQQYAIANGGTKTDYKNDLRKQIELGFAPSDAALASLNSEGGKLSKATLAQLEESKKKIIQREKLVNDLESRKRGALAYLDDSGHAPSISGGEIDKFTDGSFVGNASFYHGGRNDAGAKIQKNGIDLTEVNEGNAYYGSGFYMTPNALEAERYSQDGTGSFVELKVNVRNPAVVTSESVSDLLDSDVSDYQLSEYFLANGFDSTYVKDLDYLVAFDPRQVSATNSWQTRPDIAQVFDKEYPQGQDDVKSKNNTIQFVQAFQGVEEISID
jgi:hypothetical protein